MSARLQEYEQGDLTKPALIFAPHPDDETLACGGLIIKKRLAGAEVHVVFMTDGSGSHRHLIGPAEMKALREAEAVAACAFLGVASDAVHLFAFPDGRLAEFGDDAVAATTQTLERLEFAEVFIPYDLDPPSDHVATNQIVRAALGKLKTDTLVYEYPVWAWHHWPWVSLPLPVSRTSLSAWEQSIRQQFGLRMLRDFGIGLPTADVNERKLQALQMHRTQMFRYLPDPAWLTLHDISGGDWLGCFFREYELYRSTPC